MSDPDGWEKHRAEHLRELGVVHEDAQLALASFRRALERLSKQLHSGAAVAWGDYEQASNRALEAQMWLDRTRAIASRGITDAEPSRKLGEA